MHCGHYAGLVTAALRTPDSDQDRATLAAGAMAQTEVLHVVSAMLRIQPEVCQPVDPSATAAGPHSLRAALTVVVLKIGLTGARSAPSSRTCSGIRGGWGQRRG